MKLSRKLLITALAATFAANVQSAITPDEAKALGTNLTQIGAEKAGNKDGTIPEYKAETQQHLPLSRRATACGPIRSPARSLGWSSTPRT